MKDARPQSHTSTHHKPDRFALRFPQEGQGMDQDEEWCEVQLNGRWQRFRFHNYHELYNVPGLYEALFYRRLKCCSPDRVVNLLDDVMSDFTQSPEDLRVLDVGAGNGMVGETLRKIGVPHVVGVDIIDEAREATLRDRPDVYSDYHIADLTDLSPEQEEALAREQFNCLSVVAALGYGDIPPEAFINACRFIEHNGWLAFTIKESFLSEDEDPSGFAGLIRELIRSGAIQIQAYRRYCHRLSARGEELHYVAMIARKLAEV